MIAGALVLEVKDACDTAADMAGLEAALTTEGDPEKAREEAVMTFDCPSMIRQQLPDYESLPTKEQLLSKINSYPQAALEQSSSFYEDLRSKDWAAELSSAQEDLASWYLSMIPQTNWQLPWQDGEADTQ